MVTVIMQACNYIFLFCTDSCTVALFYPEFPSIASWQPEHKYEITLCSLHTRSTARYGYDQKSAVTINTVLLTINQNKD